MINSADQVDLSQYRFCFVNQFGDDYGWNGKEIPVVSHKVCMMRAVDGHVRDIRNMNYDFEVLKEYDVIIVNCSLHDWDALHSSEITNTTKMLEWTMALKELYSDKLIGITPEGTAGSVDRSNLYTQTMWYAAVNIVDFLLIYEFSAASYYQSMTTKPVWPLYPYVPEKWAYENAVSGPSKEKIIMIGANDFIAGKNTIGSLLAYKELKKKYPEIKAKLMFSKSATRQDTIKFLKDLDIKDVTLTRMGPWFFYVKYLSNCFLGLHLEQTITAGRFPLDCALVKIPCVSTYATSQQILYPKTTIDCFDTFSAIEKCRRLIENQDFYDECVDYAKRQLDKDLFGPEIIRQMFKDIIFCGTHEDIKSSIFDIYSSPIVTHSKFYLSEKEKRIDMGPGVKGLVSVCINTWNCLEKYSKPCIEGVMSYTDPLISDFYSDYEIVIADNASTDGTVQYLKELETKHKHIRVQYNEENLGCPGGRNTMIKMAKGEYLIMLDYDVQIHSFLEGGKDWIDYMLKTLDSIDSNQACGPLLEYEPVLNFWYLVDAIILYKREIFDIIGLYDERFTPYGYDNADFGYRMQKHGIVSQPFSGFSFPVSHPGVGAEGWTTEEKLENLQKLKYEFILKWGRDIEIINKLYPKRDMSLRTGIYREGGPIW